MGFLSRLFGKNKQPSAATLETRARSEWLSGGPTAQSKEEVAATRQRMEDELDAQRAKK